MVAKSVSIRIEGDYKALNDQKKEDLKKGMTTKLAKAMGVSETLVEINEIREGSIILDVTAGENGEGVKLLSGKGLDALSAALGQRVLGYETGDCFVGDSRGQDKNAFFADRFSATKPTKPCEVKKPDTTGTPVKPTTPTSAPSSGGFPWWGYVLSVLGLGAIVGGVFFARHSMNKGKKSEAEADGRGSYSSVSGKDKDVENASDSDAESDDEEKAASDADERV